MDVAAEVSVASMLVLVLSRESVCLSARLSICISVCASVRTYASNPFSSDTRDGTIGLGRPFLTYLIFVLFLADLDLSVKTF